MKAQRLYAANRPNVKCTYHTHLAPHLSPTLFPSSKEKRAVYHLPPPPPLLLLPPHTPIPTSSLSTRHQPLPRPLRLLLHRLPLNRMAPPRHIPHEHHTHQQRTRKQYHIHGHGIIPESKMRRSVQPALGEIQDPSRANDEAVDFAEGSEAEDFGGVVAIDGYCV